MAEESLMALSIVFFVALLISLRPATASADDHRYKQGHSVPLFASKVSPFSYPSETYKYFDLPFCHPGILMKMKKQIRWLVGSTFTVSSTLIFSFMNTVAISYGATAALPFGTIIVILLVWIAISIPFLALGGIIGYAYKSDFQAPCATRRLPLEIPIMDWYRKTPAQMFLGGLLPFSAIFIELHYINISLWGHKIYTVDYILFVVFILLIIITAILNIGLTYLQLSVEDHLWWWRSVLSGSATAIFMHAYCIYFYFRSDMSGFMQLFLFRLQCLHLLCLLYDAWHYRFPCFLSVCSSYIPQCQVGMILQACLVSSIMA